MIKISLICFLQTHSFLLHKTLIDGLEWCGLLWCFYQLFGLSFWRHPFTAEDSLVKTWCNAKFLQICSNEETNSSTSHMAWGRIHFQQIFGWTIPLKASDSQKWHISRNKYIEESKSHRFRTWGWAKTLFIFGSTVPLRKTWEMRHLRQMNETFIVCVCICRTRNPAVGW